MSLKYYMQSSLGGFLMGLFFIIAVVVGVLLAFFLLKYYLGTINIKTLIIEWLL